MEGRGFKGGQPLFERNKAPTLHEYCYLNATHQGVMGVGEKGAAGGQPLF